MRRLLFLRIAGRSLILLTSQDGSRRSLSLQHGRCRTPLVRFARQLRLWHGHGTSTPTSTSPHQLGFQPSLASPTQSAATAAAAATPSPTTTTTATAAAARSSFLWPLLPPQRARTRHRPRQLRLLPQRQRRRLPRSERPLSSARFRAGAARPLGSPERDARCAGGQIECRHVGARVR